MKLDVVSILLCAASLASCGADNGGNVDEGAEPSALMKLYSSKAELPTCNISIKNVMGYVSDEKKLYNCDGTAWIAVDIGTAGPAGAKGESGQNGAAGSTGSTGPSGSDGTALTAWIFDAAGKKVGYPVFSTVASSTFSVQAILLDGRQMELNFLSGPVINSNYYGACYYTSANCSGTCYAPQQPPIAGSTSKVYFFADYNSGGTFLTKLSSTTVTSLMTVNSNYNISSPGSCTAATSSVFRYETTAYAPTEFTWPLVLPLKLKMAQ